MVQRKGSWWKRGILWPGNAFSPVKVLSGRDLQDYFRQVRENYKAYANPFRYYERLVECLLEIEAIKVVPLYELAAGSASEEKLVGLRHDVDADPVAALRCARYLARHGLAGSFYLLHTAPYYGSFYGDCFVRHPELVQWVKSFIVAGSEIGVHNDALKAYFDGFEGALLLETEIRWLRSLGAVIRGTVGHNSGAIYGAENSELFEDRVLWPRTVRTRRGRRIPLGTVSEVDLELSYEGAFMAARSSLDREAAEEFFSNHPPSDVRSREWMERYLVENPCLTWQLDAQLWLLGQDQWAIAGHGARKTLLWNACFEETIEFLQDLPMGSRSVIVVHPEYVARGIDHRSFEP